MDHQEYRVGRFTLQSYRQLLDCGTPVPVGRKALELLSVLARAEGGLVTKEELMAAVWPNVIVEDNALQVQIAALRKLLGDDAELLSTVHGFGYRLAAQEISPAGPKSNALPGFAPPNPEARQTKTIASRHWGRPASIAALLIIAVVAGGLWLFRDHLLASKTGQSRIAVLQFEVLGGDAPLRQFAGGLETEIIERLSQSQLPVVSREDSVSLRGQDLAAAAAKLRVAYVLGGTIERSGKNLVVRLRLDDVRQSATIWSSEHIGDSADPRPLQDEIATQATQVGASAIRYFRLAEGDADAMSMLIKSDQYIYNSSPAYREAQLDNARRLSLRFPANARLLSDFAINGALLAIESSPASPGRAAELRANAKIGAQHALAIDPHDQFAYFAQALLLPSTGHWIEREKILLRGLSAAPRSSLLTNIESNFLREVGRLKDAVAIGRQAQAPIPPSAFRDATIILALGVTGNDFEARPLAEAGLKSWPSHPAIWNASFELAIFRSQWDTALGMLTPGSYVPLTEPVANAWRSALKALNYGDPTAKREAIRLIVAQLDSAPIPATVPPNEELTAGDSIGMLAVLGDNDEAFAQAKVYLKRDRYADSTFLFWPNLTKFRSDSRFMQLAAQVGLLDYWSNSGNWPDFCTDTGLPYSCRAAADALKPAN